MPRLARSVFPNVPHHITQRGNRREDIFFKDNDREFYLEWLGEYCDKWQVKILAWCLMTNHIHLILEPTTEEGLQRVLKPLHMRYAQRINRARDWKGHLWQGRFFSSPLDEAYTWAAIRYVETNPVRAGMVERAEEYRWSSAAAHCGLTKSQILARVKMEDVIPESEWTDWLAESEEEHAVKLLRRNVEKGLPCGCEQFVASLEKMAKRALRFRPQGRPAVNKG
ncbi:MAG: transposase [Candidatus Polarisedimenticolaceae bacterium]|nr:transposase [Candidatus Polarisedimenticolaceae bacterium]